jgi:hypothetical protein
MFSLKSDLSLDLDFGLRPDLYLVLAKENLTQCTGDFYLRNPTSSLHLTY